MAGRQASRNSPKRSTALKLALFMPRSMLGQDESQTSSILDRAVRGGRAVSRRLGSRRRRQPRQGPLAGGSRDSADQQRPGGEDAVAGHRYRSDVQRSLRLPGAVLQLARGLPQGGRGLQEICQVSAQGSQRLSQYRRGLHVLQPAAL